VNYHIEPVWIAQARPGGVLLVNPHSYLAAMALVKLVVQPNGSAEGRVLSDRGGFMPSRTVAGPDLQARLRELPEVSLAGSRPTRIDPQVLGDPEARRQ
jgi:hypothetical protein